MSQLVDRASDEMVEWYARLRSGDSISDIPNSFSHDIVSVLFSIVTQEAHAVTSILNGITTRVIEKSSQRFEEHDLLTVVALLNHRYVHLFSHMIEVSFKVSPIEFSNIRKIHTRVRDNSKQVGTSKQDLFKNLDFDMPDWDEIVG